MPHDQKSQDKKLNILRTKSAFKVKQKAFFIIFKGLSVAKNYLRPESAPLTKTKRSLKEVCSSKLDLNFKEHLSKIELKVNKTIGIIRELQNVLPRSALLTTYKSFIRPYLNYGDIIYEKHLMNLFTLSWNHFSTTSYWP